MEALTETTGNLELDHFFRNVVEYPRVIPHFANCDLIRCVNHFNGATPDEIFEDLKKAVPLSVVKRLHAGALEYIKLQKEGSGESHHQLVLRQKEGEYLSILREERMKVDFKVKQTQTTAEYQAKMQEMIAAMEMMKVQQDHAKMLTNMQIELERVTLEGEKALLKKQIEIEEKEKKRAEEETEKARKKLEEVEKEAEKLQKLFKDSPSSDIKVPSWWVSTNHGNWEPKWWTIKPTWQTFGHDSHIINGQVATQTSNIGTVFSSDGYNSGIHYWPLVVMARPSTCIIGVAPTSVARTSAHYSTAGHFVNFNGGRAYNSPKSNLSHSVNAGCRVVVKVDFTTCTLSFSVDGGNWIVTHNVSHSEPLFLAWNNDSTSGSVIQLLGD